MPESKRQTDPAELEARIAAFPGVARLREAAERSDSDAYLVGGSVRDALLGLGRADLDVAVVGDHLALVEALGGQARHFQRFATATVTTDDGFVDVAATRAETYSHPGALPQVRPASLIEDLDRRDFSINAIAVPLRNPFALIDPYAGVADLEARLLRALHRDSFVDDPTRALRAARYASRIGLEPSAETLALLRATDLSTVSADRVEAELRKLAAEDRARRGFELLAGWGLLELGEGAAERIALIGEIVAAKPWCDLIDRASALLAGLREPSPKSRSLAAAEPPRPSAAAAAARGASPAELIVARALGADWLDDYLADWRTVRLSISGADLLAAGVAEGPAVGRGLEVALAAKLDGETAGADDELRVALRAVRESAAEGAR